ncbi:MAG: alkaline phosphatase D family protein [Planctomycetes bacterium]|nr:alkaline phosphatase D family protein [Planctomycetota bacterium]
MPRQLLSAVVLLVAALPAAGDEFVTEWRPDIERTWIGPEYYANRLQDWRIRAGRLECLAAAPAEPLRVVHLLTAEVSSDAGTLAMRVRTGAIETERGQNTEAWTGFLLGAGGSHIDYRLTALVHHRPAPDGGLLAVVDEAGRVAFRDNETSAKGGNLWSISGKLNEGELAELPASSRRGGDGAAAAPNEIELRLEAEPAGDAYRLTLAALDPTRERLLSQAVLENVAPRLVDGGVGLVSHGGPTGGQFGHWFRNWHISGSKLQSRPERAFGPILCTHYTLSQGTLKLTAQMPPLSPDDPQAAELQVAAGAAADWRTVARGQLAADSYTIPFRVDGWDASRDQPFRVVYALRCGPQQLRACYWTGTIRSEPRDGAEFVVAAFTGNKHFTGDLQWNHEHIWFPHNELVAAVTHHNPDLLFFSGDQVYESDLTRAQREPLRDAQLDYLDKWYRWCWTFRALTRDRPCVMIPDDHDVYHGNLWGAGGRAAKGQDDGGYTMPAAFVNMVERTQTSHLPDPVDPAPIEQGIGVYFTRLDYAGLSFAIIEDRKFKSSPTVAVPVGQVVNGWFQNQEFDPATQADVPGAVLLGERQLKFLHEWAADFGNGLWMKVVLSQTVFANVATLPAEARSDAVVPSLGALAPGDYPPDDRPVADGDSNGWPQSGRNRALREMRRGFALHIAGDQHLGSFVHYGVDEWDDAGFAFCVPSIANTWPRRWMPVEPGRNQASGAPRYTGQYRDGFGNYIHVHAVSNPRKTNRGRARLYDCAPGYGIVRFRRAAREIVVECWPRWVDPAAPDAKQYRGWPITISQLDNYGRKPAGYLPELEITGMVEPVVRVIDETNREVIYALRITGPRLRPPVFRLGSYTIEVGEPGTTRWKTIRGLSASSEPQDVLRVEF